MKKYLVFIIIALLIFATSFCYASDKKIKSKQVKKVKAATVKKVIKTVKVIPALIKIVDAPAVEYGPADPIETVVTAPNTNVPVQYKYELMSKTTQVIKELYPKTKDNFGPFVNGKAKTLLRLWTDHFSCLIEEPSEFSSPEPAATPLPYDLLIKKESPNIVRGDCILKIYARAKGSKKKYDSVKQIKMIVECR